MGLEVFNDKIAVVTGAASGLGRGFCTQMAENGATIVAADINLEGAQETVEMIEARGGKAEAVHIDATDYAKVKAMIEDTVAKHGRLDYIYNNAGIAVSGAMEEIEIADWEKILAINLNAVVYGTEIAYKIMVKQGHGHIVNTASLAGLIPATLLVPYSTTKFAVVGLCESLNLEAPSRGVKVTALCPGFIDSNIYESAISHGAADAEVLRDQIPQMVDTDKGVEKLLKGVAAGKRIVTLPLYAHLIWRSYRTVPSFSIATSRKVAAKLEKDRKLLA
jgi:NAD(P)-dependent dehydrogenase (short-subunit alcohol dehydrogenase family)